MVCMQEGRSRICVHFSFFITLIITNKEKIYNSFLVKVSVLNAKVDLKTAHGGHIVSIIKFGDNSQPPLAHKYVQLS